MKDFKELKVWVKAHELTVSIYGITRSFPREEIYGLTSRLRRSAASIGANIAEGCGRRSDGEWAASRKSHAALLARRNIICCLQETWDFFPMLAIRLRRRGLLRSREC